MINTDRYYTKHDILRPLEKKLNMHLLRT